MAKCSRCGVQNAAGKRYCGDCGALLGADALDDAALRETIRNVLKERYGDQKIVEMEIAHAVATRLGDWGKLFSYFVGVPLGLLAVGLSILGITTFADFSKTVSRGKADVTKQVAAAKKQIEGLNREGETLTKQYADLRSRLQDNQNLAGQFNRLSERVDQIGERIGFTPSSADTPEQRAMLTAAFNRFAQHLSALGYAPPPGRVSIDVRTDLDTGMIAYYDDNRRFLVINKKWADNPAYMYREYMHYVLLGGKKMDTDKAWMYYNIESGLATYAACSFAGDPAALRVWNLGGSRLKISDLSGASTMRGAEAWGSAFWEVRSTLGPTTTDRLLLATWRGLRPEEPGGRHAQAFVRGLLARVDPERRTQVEQIFATRGVSL